MAVDSELGVLKTVVVPLPLVEAFALFVQQDTWWPVRTHQTYQFPPAGPPAHVELRLGDSMLALSSHAAVRQMGLPAPSDGHQSRSSHTSASPAIGVPTSPIPTATG